MWPFNKIKKKPRAKDPFTWHEADFMCDFCNTPVKLLQRQDPNRSKNYWIYGAGCKCTKYEIGLQGIEGHRERQDWLDRKDKQHQERLNHV